LPRHFFLLGDASIPEAQQFPDLRLLMIALCRRHEPKIYAGLGLDQSSVPSWSRFGDVITALARLYVEAVLKAARLSAGVTRQPLALVVRQLEPPSPKNAAIRAVLLAAVDGYLVRTLSDPEFVPKVAAYLDALTNETLTERVRAIPLDGVDPGAGWGNWDSKCGALTDVGDAIAAAVAGRGAAK
jgi:hypothetical protein